MEKISTSQITDPDKQQPFTGYSLEFLQNAKAKDDAAIIQALIYKIVGSYSLTVPYVISGCVVSDSNKDVTAGEIFYGGKYYETTAVNGTTNVARFILTKTQDATADPVNFTDGTTGNVHDIYKYVPTDVASGGDFISTDLVYLKTVISKITQNLQLSTLSTSSITYATLTGLTYTTPNDGVTRTFMIIGNTSFNFSSSAGNGAYLQIWNGASELAVNENYLAITGFNVDTAILPISVAYFGSIAPNTTISLRAKMVNSAASNYLNSSLVIVEI